MRVTHRTPEGYCLNLEAKTYYYFTADRDGMRGWVRLYRTSSPHWLDVARPVCSRRRRLHALPSHGV